MGAVRYALGRSQTILYPKRYALQDIVKRAHIEEAIFTDDTLQKLRELQIELEVEIDNLQDQQFAYSYFLREDIEQVISFLTSESVDFSGILDKLRTFAEKTVIPKIRDKLEIDYDSPPINFVTKMPGRQSLDRRGGGGFGADQWQADRYGMPRGVFIHEASLVKDSEVLLIHELTHPAIEAFPNFVPWFDEGLCNLMAFLIYFEEKGNLSFRRCMKFREEFGDYFFSPGRLFRRPDHMFCSLLLIGGLDLVKLLMRYKREDPTKVRWDIIPSLLQEGVDLPTFLEKAVEESVILPEPEISPILRRITATVLSHNISHVLSPLALLIFNKILERKPYPCTWKLEELLNKNITKEAVEKAVSELRQRFLVWIFPNGDLEPYMGPFIGTNHFVNAGLIKAWARRYELMTWSM